MIKNEDTHTSNSPQLNTNSDEQSGSRLHLTDSTDGSVSSEEESSDADSLDLTASLLELDEMQQRRTLEAILTPMKRAFVDRLMNEFWVIFDQRMDNKFRKCPNNSTSSAGNGSAFSSTGSSQHQNTATEKKRSRNRASGDDELPGDDKRDSKRSRNTPGNAVDMEEDNKFACPYRKHNPRKYCVQYTRQRWRHCALKSFPTISRLKFVIREQLLQHQC